MKAFFYLMKITSYNVNGIRAAINKGLIDWIKEDQSDIYCFQETKAQELDIPSHLFAEIGYHTYWFCAEKKGYSGVGIISKVPAQSVKYGDGIAQSDVEGRTIHADFERFKLINTYFPSGSSGDERQEFKMQFLEEYLTWLRPFLKTNQNIIIAGDYNICHKAIDIHDPISNKNSSGFLPEEREWMDRFFDSGMIDTFRYINPHPHQYSWWSYRANARNNNKGWRIDYINISDSLRTNIKDAMIHPEAKHSDHCPVSIELSL